MSTLDPNVEIPKDAPRAVGHSEDDAKAHAKANAEHAKQVKAEAETPDVGPRKPGDHAGKKSK
jgi:hypothetical protein